MFFASILLAIFLRVGLGVPILTTFITVGIIYLTHVLWIELGTGIRTAWSGTRLVANLALGVVVFLALRYLFGGLIGLYPIDTFETINGSGGLYGILPSRDIPRAVMVEVLFAFVAGGLVVAWAQDRAKRVVNMIFVGSLAILSLQIALPKYTDTFPSRDEVSTTLVNKGVVGATFKGVGALMFGKSGEQAGDNPSTPAQTVIQTVYVGKTDKSFRNADYARGCIPLTLKDDFKPLFFGRGSFVIEAPWGTDTVRRGGHWKPKAGRIGGQFKFCHPDPAPGDSIVIWAQWPSTN